MKAASLKRKGNALRFRGKIFRVFERERLDGVRWQQGCFAQDAVGEWWLCLPVKVTEEPTVAAKEAVGIDLGLKDAAVTSDGERLEAIRFYRDRCGTSVSGNGSSPDVRVPSQTSSLREAGPHALRAAA